MKALLAKLTELSKHVKKSSTNRPEAVAVATVAKNPDFIDLYETLLEGSGMDRSGTLWDDVAELHVAEQVVKKAKAVDPFDKGIFVGHLHAKMAGALLPLWSDPRLAVMPVECLTPMLQLVTSLVAR